MHIEACMPSKTRYFVFMASILILLGIFYFVDPRFTSLDPQKSAVQEANYEIADKNFAKAAEILTESIKRYPSNADMRYTLGVAYSGLGQSQYATMQYLEAVRLNPYHVQALFTLGNNYVGANQLDFAGQMLQRLQAVCLTGSGCQERDMLAGIISRGRALQNSQTQPSSPQ